MERCARPPLDEHQPRAQVGHKTGHQSRARPPPWRLMERTWSGARLSSDAMTPVAGRASSALLARSRAYGPARPLAHERARMLRAACACRYAPTAKDLASRDVVSRSMTVEIMEG